MRTIRSLLARRFLSALNRRPKTAVVRPAAHLRVERLESRDNPAPVPTVSLSVVPDPFIGQQNLPVSVTFTNPAPPATQPGFGPWTYVVLPRSGDVGNAANDGVSYVPGSATFLGAAITGDVYTATGSTLTPTGAAASYALTPAGTPVTITGLAAGDQVVFFQLPYISFSTNQPNATVQFLTSVSNQATLGAALNLRAGGGFTLGADALNNPAVDPPLVASAVAQTVTPELVRIKKVYNGPEQETATGPNYTRTYTLQAFVAPGQTISAFQLRDLLDAGMQYRPDIAVTGTANGGTFQGTAGTTAIAAQPGGTVIGNFTQVVGDADPASADASMTFSFFVPRNNSGGTNVLPLATGAFQTLTDQGGAAGNWTPLDAQDAPLTTASAYWTAAARNPTDVITAKSVAVQKGVTVVGGNGQAQQGAVLEYTINFQISDYFAFDQLAIPDLLPDGVRFLQSFVPTLTLTTNGGPTYSGSFAAANYYSPATGTFNAADGTQSLNFNVSGQLGGTGRLVGGWIPAGGTGGPVPDPTAFGNAITPTRGPTTGTIVFRAVVQNLYSVTGGGTNVKQNDTFTNVVPTTLPPNLPGGNQQSPGGRVLQFTDAATPTGARQADDTAASVTIRTGTLTKTIYAINGQILGNNPVPALQNGDVVTYRLTYFNPTSSLSNFALTDFLPLPVFTATQVAGAVGTTNSAAPPAAGAAKYGPGVANPPPGAGIEPGGVDYGTLPGQGAPSIATDGTANTVKFTFPTNLQNGPQTGSFIDLLFSVTISDVPFADGYPLTNQANSSEANTPGTTTQGDVINQVSLGRPELTVTKGVVSTTRTGAPAFGTGGATFAAPGSATPFTGTVSSTGLGGSPINSDYSGIDAGDVVTFGVVVQNTGSGHKGAFDVVVKDTIPTGFTAPAGGLNLQFRDGSGATGFTIIRVSDGVDITGNAAAIAAAFFSGTGVRLTGSGPTTADALGDNGGALDAFNATSGRNILVITYDLRANDTTQANTVYAGQSLVNTATVPSFNGTGLPGAIDLAPTNTGSLTDTATVVVLPPTLVKTLVGTSVVDATNANNQAVVGEIATYQVTASIPEGVTNNFAIVDSLPAGMALQRIVNVTLNGVTSTLTPAAPLGGPATNVTFPGGNTARFDFGTVTNTGTLATGSTANRTITITYEVVVLNNGSRPGTGNVAPNQITNSAQGAFTDPASNPLAAPPSVSAPNVTIIEPAVNVSKSYAISGQGANSGNGASTGVGQAGNTVTYTVTLSNPASGSTTAYTVALNDLLPTAAIDFGASPAIGYTGPAAYSAANFAYNGGAGTLSTVAPLATLLPGQTITLTISGTVRGSVTPNQSVSNTATDTWTSLPTGTPVGPTYTNDTQAAQRDGTGSTANGQLNDYTRGGTAAFTIQPPTPTKSLVATSEASTAGANVAIGEIARFRLVVQIPRATISGFQLQDFLPTGLRYLNDGTARVAVVGANTANLSVPAALNGALTTLPGGGIGAVTPSFALPGADLSNGGTANPFGDGDDPWFTLGDVTNSTPDTVTTGEFVVVEFNALTDNIAGNVRGTTRDNTFQSFTGGTPTTGGTANGPASAPVTLTVVEPNVAVTKQVIATSGGTVTYRLTVTNTGANASQANDVNVFDQLDGTNLTLVAGSPAVTLAGGASGATNNSAGNRVGFTITAIPVGGTVTITYTANVLTTPTGTTTLTNSATTTATSLPGPNGTAGNPTGSTAPGGAGSATGERTGSGGVNTYAASATQGLGSLGDRVYFDANADGVQDPGEQGVVGLPVTVTWAGPDGLFGTGDDSTITTTTGANGVWTVTGLPVGAGQSYRVSVPATFGGMNLTDVRDNGGAANTNPDGLGAGTSAITLDGTSAATTNNRIQDFGYRGTASLGDRVYLDTNANGVQDANGLEPSLPGVTVTLVWAGADGNLATAADNLTFTTVSTATAGTAPNYLFPNLPSGTFSVTVSAVGGAGGVPVNTSLADSVDNGTLNAAASVTTTLIVGQNRTDQDFGYQGTASLGDRVYYDANGDGIQQAGEPGIVGAAVTLVWAGPDRALGTADDVTFTATTDANGNYLFPDLPVNTAADDYRVTVTPPASFPTLTDSLDNGGAASPVNPVTVTLGQAQNRTDVDFGFRGTAALGDFVWEDRNANGRQDAGEPGIDGVPVELYFDANNDGTFQPGELATPLLTTTTAGGGLYQFPNLAAGTYRVRFGTLAGYTRTTADSSVATDATDSDANAATGFTGDYALALGGSNPTVDAGLYRPVSLGDRVYYDLNGDGVQQAGEPGIPNVGVTVVWLGPDGALGGGDDQTFNTTTGANGIWGVTNLPPGSYQVTATPFAGLDVLTDSLDNGGAPSAVNPVTVSTNSGVDRTDIDFGFRGVGRVGDTIFLDVNNNGLPDPGEGLANVTVTLTGDLNGDGTVAANETLTTTTNGVGFYQFTGLRTTAAGVPYTVRVVTSTLPQDGPGSPVPNTVDPDGGNDNTSAVTLTTAAPSNQAQDFGYRNTVSGIIGDAVFLDVNGNGLPDPGEGIAGVLVTLTATVNGAAFTATATTGPTGNYLFSNLPLNNSDGSPITYTVTVNTFDLPLDATNTADPDGGNDSTSLVTLTPANPTNLNQDFGYRGPGSIGDRVFLDLNNNGVWDAGEGITVPVTLTADVNGDGVQDLNLTVTTDADGFYLFDGLPVSLPSEGLINYTVTVAVAQLPAGVSNTVDPDGTTDSTWTGTLSTGPAAPNRRDIDFGYRGTGSLGDRVWFDSNGDGVQDPVALEPGVPFAGLTLTYAGQDGTFGTVDDVTTALTADVNGAYRFDNLPAGRFRVDVAPATLPGNVTPTYDLDGTGTANAAVATLTDGQARTDVDFGYRGAAGLGDRVWLDQNRNGVQDPAEFGVVGAVVRLTMAGPDGTLGTADDRVYTTTTGADGLYSFPGLPVYGRGGDPFRVDVTSVPGVGALMPISDLDSPPTTGDQTAAGTLGASQVRTDVDFGYDSTGSLSGTVFLDPNNDGLQGAGEGGLGGVTLTLSGTDVFGNPIVDPVTGGPLTTATDANGFYHFDTLLPGTYTVTETQPAGLLDGTDTTGTVGGTAGQGAADADRISGIILLGGASFNNNFAELPPASVSGTVYEDRNRNRTQDPSEPGIPNATVTLTGTDDRGPVTRTLVTDANGFFRFDRLRPGTYTLTETQPGGFAQSGNAVGTAGGTQPQRDVITGITLAAGQSGLSYLFGEVRVPPPAVPVSPAPPVDPSKQQFLTSSPTVPPTTPTFAALGSVDPTRPTQFLATADGPGGQYVRVFDLTAGVERFRFQPFPGFAGGMTVATGDVTGDGIPDIVVGAGAGGGPQVLVYDGSTGALAQSFFAFEPFFRGGVTLAVGDFNNDGKGDVAVGAGAGGGPRVRVFSGGDPNAVMADFYGIDDIAFRGGVRLAAGDLNADGVADLVAAAGAGGGPRVAAYSGPSVAAGAPVRLFGDFAAFEPQLRNGTYVAAADVDGDGYGDLIVGAGEGGAPRVSAFSGKALLSNTYVRVADFFAFNPATDGGVRVAARDLSGDGKAEIVAAAGVNAQPYVRFVDPLTQQVIDEFAAEWTNSLTGVYVG